MLTFRWKDYGSGIITEIEVSMDGPLGDFFSIAVPVDKTERFVECIEALDNMLPKNTTIVPLRSKRNAAKIIVAAQRAMATFIEDIGCCGYQ
jgi:hypothetical protein